MPEVSHGKAEVVFSCLMVLSLHPLNNRVCVLKQLTHACILSSWMREVPLAVECNEELTC